MINQKRSLLTNSIHRLHLRYKCCLGVYKSIRIFKRICLFILQGCWQKTLFLYNNNKLILLKKLYSHRHPNNTSAQKSRRSRTLFRLAHKNEVCVDSPIFMVGEKITLVNFRLPWFYIVVFR